MAGMEWNLGDDGVVRLENGILISMAEGVDEDVLPFDQWSPKAKGSFAWTITVTDMTGPSAGRFPYWSDADPEGITVLDGIRSLLHDGKISGWAIDAVEAAVNVQRYTGSLLLARDAGRLADGNRWLFPRIGALDLGDFE